MKVTNRLRLVSLLASVTIAIAQDVSVAHRVEQKNREFNVKEITIKPGAKIDFCNIDDVTHNVFSRSKANSFTIKTQAPGSSSLVEFKEEGVTEVRCAIHPGMKLVVTVKN